MSGEPIALILYVIAWLVGLVLAFTWLVFPFIVRGQLNKLIDKANQIDVKLSGMTSYLAAIDAKLKPVATAPIPQKLPSQFLAVCKCSECGQNVEFDVRNFDAENPPVINCPHCEQPTQLYLEAKGARSTAGI